ncbi:MAG: hypothetical protein J5I98_04570 [Phaeodactylibacter sp.]|nr:hypothetical protein [Phaeodactylibacter sp.]
MTMPLFKTQKSSSPAYFLGSLIFSGLLFLGSASAQGQCDTSVLRVERNGQPVRFSVLLGDSAARLNDFIRVSSPAGGAFEAEAGGLRDERTGKTIPASHIRLAPTAFTVAKGDTEEVGLEVAPIGEAGLFAGQLFITHPADSCHLAVPIELEVVRAGQLTVLEPDRNLEVKVVSPSWLNGLIPRKIRHQGLVFRVENHGASAVTIDRFSLSLKGQSTEQALTEKDVSWQGEEKAIGPESIQTIRLSLNKDAKLDADEYKGFLRIHFEGALKPITLPVTLYARVGVGGAILVLLLGIFVGRMMKDVNKAGDQLEVMGRFIPIRARVEKMDHEPTRNLLIAEMNELEAEINKVADSAGREAVEKKLDVLDRKVAQLQQMFRLFSDTEDRMKKMDLDAGLYNEIVDKFLLLRTAILEGKDEESKKVLADIQSAIGKMGASRDVTRGSSGGIGAAVQAEMAKLNEALEDKGGETKPAVLSWGDRAGKWALRILDLIAGVKVTARVRYGLFRPLVALAAFLVIVLLGFQEIYVNGGDTFGLEGVYDYLKLFLWGIVSDVFSRTLIGNSSVESFMGKSADK